MHVYLPHERDREKRDLNLARKCAYDVIAYGVSLSRRRQLTRSEESVIQVVAARHLFPRRKCTRPFKSYRVVTTAFINLLKRQ